MWAWRLLLYSLCVVGARCSVQPLYQQETNKRSTPEFLKTSERNLCAAGKEQPCFNSQPLIRALKSRAQRTLGSRERKYVFNISRSFAAPDGVNSSTLLVNGGFPGPTIEANLGDTFVVTVYNYITGPEAGTSIHWHGLAMKNNQFMDGVPSISQCPIAPGESFTYRFDADRPGTSWWHSHFASQTAGGLFGAMIIHGPREVRCHVDIGPILLTDRYHRDYKDLVDRTTNGELVPSDSNLINGKGTFDCSKVAPGLDCTPGTPKASFKFQSGKTHRLRLINAGASGLQRFSIDGHELRIIAVDYVPVQPFTAPSVVLAPGQRSDVLVEGQGSPIDSFFMRAEIICSASREPRTVGHIFYEKADASVEPTSEADHLPDGCDVIPIQRTVPITSGQLPSPSLTQYLDFTVAPNETGTVLFFTNNGAFRANFNEAMLERTTSPSVLFSSFPNERQIYNVEGQSSVRIVMKNHFISTHPMHLHGHDFYVLADGMGDWDGKIINPENPLRRDTHQMWAANEDGMPSYTVIQFDLDNAGIWPFHCHITSHLGLGMSINFAYGKKEIEQMVVPEEIREVCDGWLAYAKANPVDQPDSGLRLFV